MSDSSPAVTTRTSFPVLSALSVCHLLNDMVQSLLQRLQQAVEARETARGSA